MSDDEYSSSEYSSSCSDYDEDYYSEEDDEMMYGSKNKRMGQRGAANVGAAKVQQQRPVAVSLQAHLSQLDAALSQPTEENLRATGLGQAPELQELRLRIDQNIPVGVLQAQPDGGAKLRLRLNNGFKVISNTASSTVDANGKPVAAPNRDIFHSVTACLKNNIETPLLMTLTSVPMQAGQLSEDELSINAKSTTNPHGNVALTLPADGSARTFERPLTAEQLMFYNLFGEFATWEPRKMAHRLEHNPAKMQITTGTPVHHYYNLLPEVIAAGAVISGKDEEGMAYGRAEWVNKAVEYCEKMQRDVIAAANVSVPEQLEIVISMPIENERVSDRQPQRLKQTGLASYISSRAVANANPSLLRKLEMKLAGGEVIIRSFRPPGAVAKRVAAVEALQQQQQQQAKTRTMTAVTKRMQSTAAKLNNHRGRHRHADNGEYY